MGTYHALQELWTKPSVNLGSIYRERLIRYRREPSVVKIERPTRLDKAHALGYKAKQGFVLARVRLMRGGRKRKKFKGGRRSKHMRRVKIVGKSHQWIAEERANKKFHNCEVLNSYYLARDGIYKWYEVILVDTSHPAIKADKKLSWITEDKHKGRVYRGLTSAGRKSRGLLWKGKGAEKLRPSLRAHKRRGKS